jgi:hypothetical protein
LFDFHETAPWRGFLFFWEMAGELTSSAAFKRAIAVSLKTVQ